MPQNNFTLQEILDHHPHVPDWYYRTWPEFGGTMDGRDIKDLPETTDLEKARKKLIKAIWETDLELDEYIELIDDFADEVREETREHTVRMMWR